MEYPRRTSNIVETGHVLLKVRVEKVGDVEFTP